MMYTQIDANKRKTTLLIFIFTGLVVALGWAFGQWFGDPGFGITAAVVLATIMNLVGYFKGDRVALAAAGAKEVTKKEAPELHRLVENLCITAGLPMPTLYVIDDPAPNAFATGRDPEHASIAVSTGLLSLLNKTELEGVLAHELSHIGNYDIRIMTIVVVLVGVIMLLSDWMTRSLFYGNQKRENNQGTAILMVIGIALAILSPIIAQLLKLAISRSREYLADASGALLTRHPEGLASALEKIASLDRPMKRANHATAHLFLANPFDPHVTKRFEHWFSTHPPIDERIKKLRSNSTH